MKAPVRTGLGVLLTVGCLVLAVFSSLHGVVFGALLAGFTAALFAWAVYDNMRVSRNRAARTQLDDTDTPPPPT